MKKILAFFGAVAFFLVLVSITGSTGNVAFGVPGMLIVGIAATVCLGSKEKNVFEPVKWVAVFYSLSFAVFPVLLNPPDLAQYSRSNIHESQWYLLLYLLLFLIGYKLCQVVFPAKALSSIELRSAASDYSRVGYFAAAIFLLGFLGYSYAIFKSGGIGYFLNFTGPRPELFQHVHGLYFRLSMFMASGYALFAAVHIRKHPILLGGAALVLGVAYFLFLGRGLAVTPIIIFITLYHYRVKRIKARYVALGVMMGILLLAITTAYRSAGKNRESLIQNPVAFIQAFAVNATESVEGNLLSYFEHLDTFMLIEKNVSAGNPLLKGRTLTMWFEPFDRFFLGNKLVDSVSSGHFVAVLRRPNFEDFPVGEWPTLAGEFVLNFGLLGAGLCMFCYGAIIQMISRFLRVGACSEISLAIHPQAFYILSLMTLAGSNMLVSFMFFAIPLLCLTFVVKKNTCQIDWMQPSKVNFLRNQAVSGGVYR